VFSVSLWWLFRARISSFVSVSSCILSLVFLECQTWCTLWLTMSSYISMKFSVITCRISSFRLFLLASLGSWHSLSLFCWSLELGIHFLLLPLSPVLIYFWEENGFHPFLIFPSFHLVLCNFVLNRLLVVSVTWFLSLGSILFCGCVGFNVSVCVLFLSLVCV
jgi:hypothetical protein